MIKSKVVNEGKSKREKMNEKKRLKDLKRKI